MNKGRLLYLTSWTIIAFNFLSCLVPPSTDTIEEVVGKEPFPIEIEDERYLIPGDFDFEGTVARWYGFSQAAASLTFDDGTIDQYATAWPILEELDVKGTFYIAADLIEKGSWDDRGSIRKMMSWDNAAEIAMSGHEIGSHSMNHKDLSKENIDYTVELKESRDLIESRLPGVKAETFCWPHWRENGEALKEASRYYLSARSGNGVISYYYDRKGGIPLDPPSDMFSVNALGIRQDHEPDDWMPVAEEVYDKGSWFVTSFHGVEAAGADPDELGWSALSDDDFRQVVSFIKEKGYWIDTFAAVSKYIYQRDAAVLHIKNSSDSLTLTLDDDLDDSIYDQKLSVSLKIPENWEKAAAYDSEGSLIESKIAEGRLFLDLYPRKSTVIIKPY